MSFKSILKGFYLSWRYGKKVNDDDTCIQIHLPENKFNRYLYPLVYMLHQNGYKPVLNLNLSGIAHLSQDGYQALILTEHLLFKSNKNRFVKSITLNPDYFTALHQDPPRTNIIPMCMHPLVYKNNLSINANQTDNKVIFFAGTTTGEGHDKVQIFQGIITRDTLINEIKQFDNAYFVEQDIVDSHFQDNMACQLLIFERHKINLSQAQMFNYMSQSSFFLAMPGRGMPLCHNLIEAMYCGCIPILQDKYAEMMPIPLENHVNCLTFSDISAFREVIRSINALPAEIIKKMRADVAMYYQNYLSPKAITNQLVDSDEEMFYLQAEGFSIKLFSKHNIN